MSRTYDVVGRAKGFINDWWRSREHAQAEEPWTVFSLPVTEIMRHANAYIELEIERAIFIGSALIHAKHLAANHAYRKITGEKR